MHRFSTLSANVAPATMLALIGLSSSARHAGAEPLRPAFIATNIDWTSAAVGGIGGGRDATGTITLDGVSGTVRDELLGRGFEPCISRRCHRARPLQRPLHAEPHDRRRM